MWSVCRVVLSRCLSGKLWYLEHSRVGDTIVYHEDSKLMFGFNCPDSSENIQKNMGKIHHQYQATSKRIKARTLALYYYCDMTLSQDF